MKVLGIIPSRFGSKRFPGKPLIDLKGKTMIERVYMGAKKSKMLDHLIVATDDMRIYNEVKRFGGEVVMTSKNHDSGTERCAEVIEKYNDYDLVINIQGDEPMINHVQIDQLIGLFLDKSIELGTLAIPFKNKHEVMDANRVKVVMDKNNCAIYFSRSIIPYAESESFQLKNYIKHIGIYAYRRSFLESLKDLKNSFLENSESLEQLKWIYNGFKIHVCMTNIQTPNIDTPEDIKAVIDLLE